MSGPTLSLADDFAPPSREDWLKLVEKTLKGETFEDALVRRTADGIVIAPLYTAAPATVAGSGRSRMTAFEIGILTGITWGASCVGSSVESS